MPTPIGPNQPHSLPGQPSNLDQPSSKPFSLGTKPISPDELKPKR